MKNIIIAGTGAVAAEITSYIEDTSFGKECGLQIKGYLEYPDNIELYYNKYKFQKPVLGDLDSYQPEEDDYFVIGVANIQFRRVVIEKLQLKSANFITLVHPSAIVARTATIGLGNVINPTCIIGPNVVIGEFNLLTSGTMLSHDCKVGDNNVFSTAVLCGHGIVGNDNEFGIRSSVIPHIEIGDKNLIQAGMIVDKNVEDDTVVFHRFKEKVYFTK